MNTTLVLLGVMAVTPVDISVTRLQGDVVAGQLSAITSQQIVLKTADGDLTLKSDELLVVKPTSQPTSPVPRGEDLATVVTLTDGSVLHASKYTVASGRATVTLLDGTDKTVPTRAVAHVRLMKQTPAIAALWQDVLRAPRESDSIVIRKTADVPETQDEATAKVVLDAPEGVLSEIDEATVGFEFDGSSVNVPRRRVEGVVYFHRAASTVRSPICQVRDTSGSRWNARTLKLDDDALQGISVSGVRFVVPLAQLVTLDYSVGNIDFLSDLPRESVVWKPRRPTGNPPSAFRWFSPKFDTGLYGSVLKLDDEPYEKGLALHSYAEVTYRFTKRYRRLLARVGIDDSFRYEANLELRIYGDNTLVFSRHITGRDDAFDLDLDMQGIRRLKIVVDYGEDDSDRGDNLNLCNARLTK